MRERLLLMAASAFLLGILWGQYTEPVYVVLVVGLGLYHGIGTARRRYKGGACDIYGKSDKEAHVDGRRGGRSIVGVPLRLGCILGIFVLGMFHVQGAINERELVLGQLSDGESVRLQGTIDKKEQKEGQLVCELSDAYVESEHIQTQRCGRVRVEISSDYSIGTILTLHGKVNLFTEATNEGGFDWRGFYQSQGVWFGLYDAEVIRQQEAGFAASGGGTFNRLRGHRNAAIAAVREQLYQLRVSGTQTLKILMSEENAGVLAGMLLGERSGMDAETKQAYRDAGISHILAISALHVSIFAFGLYRLLRRRGGPVGAAVWSMLMLWCYAQMTGNSLSTGRAVVMFLLMALAPVAGRSYDMLNALGLWTLTALWENPFLPGYSGFVFTVTAVVGIGVTVQLLKRQEREAVLTGRDDISLQGAAGRHSRDSSDGAFGQGIRRGGAVCVRLRDGLISGIGIQLTTLPVVAFYSYEIPIYAIFLNLLVLPLMPVVLISGAAAVTVGSRIVFFGKLFALPAELVLNFYRGLSVLSLRLPMAQIIVGHPPVEKLFAYYAGLAAALYMLHRCSPESLAKWRRGVYVGFVVLVMVFCYHPSCPRELDILDVGQGLGIYFGTDDGSTFFIDGGSTSKRSIGTYGILPFLKAKGIGAIDYWCISHADEDHINGAVEVFASGYPVRHLILAEAMPRDEAYQGLIAAAEADGAEIVYMRAKDRLVLPDGELVCVFPGENGEHSDNVRPSGEAVGETTTEDRNQRCLALLWRGRQLSCLFPGDLSQEEERIMLEDGLLDTVDIYIAAHHGSRYSSSEELMQRLRPRAAVVSCSLHNTYGHPGAEAVANMEAAGARVYYTMMQGRVRFVAEDDGGLRVDTYCGTTP